MQHSSQDSSASASHGSRPATLAELKASGHLYRTVKQEIRENLIARMRAGQNRFPGIVGFDQTVLPHVERALIAGHDIILLGERGQGKDPADPHARQPARRVDADGQGLRDQRSPVRPGLRALPAPVG